MNVSRKQPRGGKGVTDWPQTATAWAAAIEKGLGLTNAQARAACEGDQFPFDRLEAWVRKAFGNTIGLICPSAKA